MSKRVILLILLGIFILLLVGCAPVENPKMNADLVEGTIAGFWYGLWHGLIMPVTFVISLFTSKVGVYEVYNNGGWYNFGYLIGLSIIFGGSGGGAACRRKVVVVRD